MFVIGTSVDVNRFLNWIELESKTYWQHFSKFGLFRFFHFSLKETYAYLEYTADSYWVPHTTSTIGI